VNLAALLLLTAAARHYLWQHFPPELQGMASKGLGSAQVLVLLACVWQFRQSRPLGLVLLFWAWEELQTVLCSLAYMVQPWEVPAGVGICSARIGFDLGAAGILAVAYIAHTLSKLTVSTNGGNRQNERH
jgi:hypothetical protein